MKCEYCDKNEATVKDYRDFYDGIGFSKYYCCESCLYKSNKTVKGMITRRFNLDKKGA